MSKVFEATEILPFFGLLFREDLISFEDVFSFLNKKLPLLHELDFFLEDAGLINYYEKEMGPRQYLRRCWVFSRASTNREVLLPLKLQANDWEESFCHRFNSTGRVVNIDPGYIALEQVILSTCKPYGHRIFLGKEVYAELTYQFQEGKYHDLPWTYPDYRSEIVRAQFSKAKAHLKELLVTKESK